MFHVYAVPPRSEIAYYISKTVPTYFVTSASMPPMHNINLGETHVGEKRDQSPNIRLAWCRVTTELKREKDSLQGIWRNKTWASRQNSCSRWNKVKHLPAMAEYISNVMSSVKSKEFAFTRNHNNENLCCPPSLFAKQTVMNSKSATVNHT